MLAARKRAMQNAMRLGAQGIKIMSSGRLNGIEIARKGTLKTGFIGTTATHAQGGNIVSKSARCRRETRILTAHEETQALTVIDGAQLIPLAKGDRQVSIHPELTLQRGDTDPGALIAGFDGQAVGAAFFGDDKSLSFLLC